MSVKGDWHRPHDRKAYQSNKIWKSKGNTCECGKVSIKWTQEGKFCKSCGAKLD